MGFVYKAQAQESKEWHCTHKDLAQLARQKRQLYG